MSEIPSLLSQSPLFQLEKLRKTTRDAVEEALSAKDVTLREYWVLTCLASAPTTQQAELTEALGIDPSDIVRILDKLVRKGLVTRQRAPEDRRRQVVALKKTGRKLHKKLANKVTEAEKTALDDSSKKQLKQLRKMSKAVLTPADDE
ncbi:MarR family transcriptional regulator [uncultured Corynebacterium sp.]|uniref:MarR family winged helix-turn-helix transcriptional regulator n=1 Tax=uncultured Corynebacterium sp. TaxID=159447 RepID=UPI00260E0AC3|nr:MarR family transcriptional regulator [uncultured Corynebacterium sp.]